MEVVAQLRDVSIGLKSTLLRACCSALISFHMSSLRTNPSVVATMVTTPATRGPSRWWLMVNRGTAP
jgi:hypothetical protein